MGFFKCDFSQFFAGGICIKQERKLDSLRCEEIKDTNCAKLSSLHCLHLDPASGKLLMLAGGEQGER